MSGPRCLMACVVLSIFLIGAVSCRSAGWPFPLVDRGRSVEEVLAERTRCPRNLYAELSMTIESPERSGVFDAVVQFSSGRGLRMTAFKDVIVSTRPIFDIRVEADTFELVYWGRDGAPERRVGPVRRASQLDAAFAVFALLRERMFLPGRKPRDSSREIMVAVADAPASVAIMEKGEGFSVTWDLEPDTLGVRRATLAVDDGSTADSITWRRAHIDFLSYRLVGSTFYPDRFVIRQPSGGLVIEGALEHLELDLDPGELDFEPFEDDVETLEPGGGDA